MITVSRDKPIHVHFELNTFTWMIFKELILIYNIIG